MSDERCCCGAQKACEEQTAHKGPERRKPLVRIVCPLCGLMLWVNALDKAGQTENKCRSCAGLVFIETDDEGCVIRIEGQEQEKEKQPDWLGKLKASLPLALIGILVLMFFKACGSATPARPYGAERPASSRPMG